MPAYAYTSCIRRDVMSAAIVGYAIGIIRRRRRYRVAVPNPSSMTIRTGVREAGHAFGVLTAPSLRGNKQATAMTGPIKPPATTAITTATIVGTIMIAPCQGQAPLPSTD